MAVSEERRAYTKEYREKNKEKIAADLRRWRAENRETLCAKKKAYREANREKVYAGQRDWVDRNREKNLAQMKAWRQANIEAVRAYDNERHRLRRLADPENYRRRARAIAATRRARLMEAFVEYVDPKLVWERDKGICGVCGLTADIETWHLDHIVPLARGGEHSYANTQVTHPFCNQSKGASWQ